MSTSHLGTETSTMAQCQDAFSKRQVTIFKMRARFSSSDCFHSSHSGFQRLFEKTVKANVVKWLEEPKRRRIFNSSIKLKNQQYASNLLQDKDIPSCFLPEILQMGTIINSIEN